MKACLDFDDILGVGRPQIAETQRLAEACSETESQGACAAFTRQVRLLEGVVVHTYGVAATLARRAEDLREVAEIWRRMSHFCQETLSSLGGLKDQYAACGTPELYDLVLDYKLASDKRHKGVLEEIACQKTDLPEGLLPGVS